MTLYHNGSSISDTSVIAEVFNNYFWNIASNIDSDIPHWNISPFYFLGAPVENSFFCSPSDSEEIVIISIIIIILESVVQGRERGI